MATNREIMEKFLQFINTGDAAIDRPMHLTGWSNFIP